MDAFLRRYATPLSLVTGIGISITGILMFFGVRGELGDIHEWLGWAFVVALLMHIVRNWRGLLGMLQPRINKALVGVLGIALTVLVVTSLPLGGQSGGNRAGGPWAALHRVADAPITASAPALGLTSDQAIAKLKAKGIAVENPQQSLNEVAEKTDVELPRIFAALMTEG